MEINANNTCRTCLHKTDGEINLSDVLDSNNIKYSEMLTLCINVEVSLGLNYPNKLCQSCSLQLPTVWKFITMCRESDKTLQKYFKNTPLKPSELVEVKVEIKEEFIPPHSISDNSNDGEESEEECIEELKKNRRTEKKTNRRAKNKIECSKIHIQQVVRAFANAHGPRRIRSKSRAYMANHEVIQCPSCDHVAETQCRLKKHVRLHHPDLLDFFTFPCKTCGKVFKRRSDLVVHTRLHTGETPYACSFCPKSFNQVGTLIRHRRIHTGERPYACELCPKLFATSSMLRTHALVHSDEKHHSCQFCGKAFKSRNTLVKHAVIHQGSKPIICELCGIVFSTKGNLTSHIKKIHSEESGQCTVCSKHCANLSEHMHVHTGKAAFPCQVCSKGFTQRRSLANHMQKHAVSTKHKCDKEHCDKSFHKKCMLEFHIRKYHTGETPYVCKVCFKGFFRTSDLKKHIKVHH